MIKNYIKTAWRNLWKGRIFNLMNVTGLAVAVACCTLIFLTVFYEFSYDRFTKFIPHLIARKALKKIRQCLYRLHRP
jgi:hypothetical protein